MSDTPARSLIPSIAPTRMIANLPRSGSVGVSHIQPAGPVFPQHPSQLPEYLDYVLHV